MIDWLAFLLVLGSALVATVVVVITYSLGIRLLTVSGRTPIVTPAEFTDAITVVTPGRGEGRREEGRQGGDGRARSPTGRSARRSSAPAPASR